MLPAEDPVVGLWLGRMLVTLGAVIAASVGSLLVRHAVSVRLEERRRHRIAAAAEQLAPLLAGRAAASSAVAIAVRSWGRSSVAVALRRARRSLAGEAESDISALLEEIGETRRLARAARLGGVLRRGRALRCLAGCGGQRARRELLRACADRRAEIRRVAREGLLELRDPFSARAAIAAFLGEKGLPHSWSRSFFVRLAFFAPAELRQLIADRQLEEDLEKLALEALAETGDAAAAPLALTAARSPAAELRASGIRLIGAIGDPRWSRLLIGLLDDPEWFVRAAAARALGGLGDDNGVLEALGAGLADSHWWVRANAARSLARLGPQGMNRLARAATAGHAFARQAAMPELLRLADTRPAPPEDDLATRDLAPPLDDGSTRDLAVAS